MSEVINGVPRELLERAERNLCSGEEAYRTQQDLRAVLTAQPQASAAQSAPDDSHSFKNFHRLLCERFGYTHDEKDWRRDQLSLIEHIAAQSAPDEREAFEAAVAAVNERGWTTSTDLAWQIWDSCAAWQRRQSAPVVPEGCRLVPDGPTTEMRLAGNRAINEAGALLCGISLRQVYDAMLAAAPQPAAQGEAVYQIQYLGDGGGGWCDVEKSEHDSYSAQQDYRTRTLYAHATAARQEQGDDGVLFGFDDRSVRVSQEAYSIFLEREHAAENEVRRLREALEMYAAAYNEHWKPGMPILEPISDAALSASAEGKNHG